MSMLNHQSDVSRATISVYPVSYTRRWVVKVICGEIYTVPQRMNKQLEWVWRPMDLVCYGSKDSISADMAANRDARQRAFLERQAWT